MIKDRYISKERLLMVERGDGITHIPFFLYWFEELHRMLLFLPNKGLVKLIRLKAVVCLAVQQPTAGEPSKWSLRSPFSPLAEKLEDFCPLEMPIQQSCNLLIFIVDWICLDLSVTRGAFLLQISLFIRNCLWVLPAFPFKWDRCKGLLFWELCSVCILKQMVFPVQHQGA